MHSDKRNLIKAKAAGLISSLFNVALSGDLCSPFHDQGTRFHERVFCIFRISWIDCRGAFHAVLSLNDV